MHISKQKLQWVKATFALQVGAVANRRAQKITSCYSTEAQLTPTPRMEPMSNTKTVRRDSPSPRCGPLAALLGTVLAVAAALKNLPREDATKALITMFVAFACSSKWAAGSGDPALHKNKERKRKVKSAAARTRRQTATPQPRRPNRRGRDSRGRNPISRRSFSPSARRGRKTPPAKQAARSARPR